MVIISLQLERTPFDHQIRYRMLNRTKREEPPVAGTTGGSFVYYGVLISFFVD
jgi:hypothetical protein